MPWTVQRAIEALEGTPDGAPIAGYATLILALAAANAVARLASRFAVMGAAQRVEDDLRRDLYASLERYPPAFYARHATGDLMTRASSDGAAVRTLAGFGVISLGGTAFAVLGALGAMLALDPWLTLWAMAPYALLVLFAARANTEIHERTRAAQDQLGALSARVQEFLAGVGVVRAYTMEAHAAAVFGEANRTYLQRSLALARALAAFVPLAGLLTGLGALITLWLGGRAVAEGRLTLGALVAFQGYLAYLAWPTLALGLTLTMVRRGLTSLARIQEIVAGAPAPEPAAAPLAGPPAIRFVGCTFGYERRAVLHDVSLEVAAGELVAVVGPTGSGKSTLGVLLARLWEPAARTVFLNGRDVTTEPRRAIRAAVGYVPQEAFLFSRSIVDNVGLGRDGLDGERARRAASLAAVRDEIEEFPEGWSTVVGERGWTLSGGQRQRVALARALAGEPAVLVLDDVFASVDPVTEAAILDNLRALAVGRAVLVMTHRLRAARAADRVVVLVDGRVVETGTPAALAAADGPYARLLRQERLAEEIARA